MRIVNNVRRYKRIIGKVLLLGVILPAPLLAGDIEAGKRLYQQGISVDPANVSVAGGIKAQVSSFPCQSCHQADANGGVEGGVNVPAITWRDLTVRSPASSIPAYTEALLKRAITTGIGSTDKPLHSLMPRYTFSEQDFANLFSYLQKQHTVLDAGITPDRIRIGVVLTEQAAFAEVKVVVKQVLENFFNTVNTQGGIHGRSVELVFATPTQLPTDVVCHLAWVVPVNEALISPSPLSPVLFPLTPVPSTATSVAFQAGLTEQFTSLFTYMQTHQQNEKAGVLVVDADLQGEQLRQKIKQLSGAADRLKIISTQDQDWVQQIMDTGIDTVFWFSRTADWGKFTQLLPSETVSTVYSSVDLLGNWLTQTANLPVKVSLILSNPRGTPDQASNGYQMFQTFRQIHRLPAEHGEWQRSSYLAARLLEQTLKQAGRELSQQRLLTAAQNIENFQAGVMPPISTNAKQSHPSQILRFEATSHSLKILADWLAS